jgi:hypothetical protein
MLATVSACSARHRAGSRGQQARGDGDGEVGAVVVGEGHHAAAVPAGEAGEEQGVGLAGVGAQGRHVGLVALQLQVADLAFVLLDDHRPVAEFVEGLADQVPGLAVAADQEEVFPQAPHLAGKALHRQALRKFLSCSIANTVPRV